MAKKKGQQPDPPKLKPITSGQRAYKQALESATITFCTGPAGTGKGFVACGVAAELLKAGAVEKIILTRPLVHCGSGQIGILPGMMDEKMGPYFRVLEDCLGEFIPLFDLRGMVAKKFIEFVPLELMRGMTLKRSFIIADEIQNAERVQVKMLLTRIGEGSKMVLVGDTGQTDLKHESPLSDIANRLKGHRDIRHVQLTGKDIVRHPLIAFIDERLSDGVPQENSVDIEEVEVECPNCEQVLIYDDDGQIEQLRCWNCYRHIDFDDNDEPFLTDQHLPKNMVTETRNE